MIWRGIKTKVMGYKLKPDNIKPVPKPRKKKCKSCGKLFQPFNSLQICCCLDCAKSHAPITTKKRAEAKRKANREDLKRFRDGDRSYQLKKAQEAFNKFIRLRDKHLPCISCGRHHKGQYHAGHYRTVGAMPQLRFEEFNCHKQCSACNNHKSGNIVEYRINLVKKIGTAKVEWLEGNHEPKKYTLQEIIDIKNRYKAKCKEIES